MKRYTIVTWKHRPAFPDQGVEVEQYFRTPAEAKTYLMSQRKTPGFVFVRYLEDTLLYSTPFENVAGGHMVDSMCWCLKCDTRLDGRMIISSCSSEVNDP